MRKRLLLLALSAALGGCVMGKHGLGRAFALGYDPAAGRFACMEHKLFSLRACLTGLFEPGDFNDVIGFGILLDEPHVPGRIPVLLVHGLVTGPRAMKHVAASLDRDRFEPWYAFYPTGYSIAATARMLEDALRVAAKREGIDGVAAITYSHGGLVLRKALGRWSADSPAVPTFIAVSTPWAGTSRVGKWAWISDVPDSWKDLRPGSEFLEHLFDDPMPAATSMHVMCGSGGNSWMVHGIDDNVTEVDSLLDPRALSEASTTIHYDYLAHDEMVEDAEPLAHMNDLLDRAF